MIIADSDPRALANAAQCLEKGEVIAIPTDTVYGLAARIDRPVGIRAIFAIKNRPEDLALPVLIGDDDQVPLVASQWPKFAALATAKFWPGPLTVVVPTFGNLGKLLGKLESVGIRRPDHRFVEQLCLLAGPLCVTSANRHRGEPATSADQIDAEFLRGEIDLVIDGGECGGVASTVIDVSVTPPVLLRKGAIAWPAIKAVLA